jgi:uncharacterized membrane protein
MDDHVVLERRASTVLHHYLRSVGRSGAWLLPANVCPIVPAVFKKAGISYEFVDIQQQSLCLDFSSALSLLRRDANRYVGVLFVRTYGHRGDFEPFFRDVKGIDAGLRVIDDRCLARPSFSHSGGVTDLELYSTGYAKFVELGWGGWGVLREPAEYSPVTMPFQMSAHEELVSTFRKVLKERCNFDCPDTPWLDTRDPDMLLEKYRCLVEERTRESALHRDSLNAIYAEQLEPWALPAQFRDWRFTLHCNCQEELLRTIFAAGHFASAHYASLIPMFGLGVVPVADAWGKQVVNLFNDFRYDPDRARQLATLVHSVLQRNATC